MKRAGISILCLAALLHALQLNMNLVSVSYGALGIIWLFLGSIRREKRRPR